MAYSHPKLWHLDTLFLKFISLLLINGTASDVAGIDSETVLRNTVSESRIVTSEKGNDGENQWGH